MLREVPAAQRYLQVVAGNLKELVKARKKTPSMAHFKGCQKPPATPLITGCWHLTPYEKSFSRGWLKTILFLSPALEQISGN